MSSSNNSNRRTITVSKSTYDELGQLGSLNTTYDQVIRQLVSASKKEIKQ